MRESLIILYLANIGSILLLYVGVWVQDRRPYLRFFIIAWLLYFVSYSGYFLFEWAFGGAEGTAYRTYAEITYYAASVALYVGILRLHDRPVSLPAKSAFVAAILYVVVGRWIFDAGSLAALVPSAAINAVLFWHAAWIAFVDCGKHRLLCTLAGIGLAGWGTSLIIYPTAYATPAIMNAVYAAGGGFGILLMLDLVVLHYALINERLTEQTDRIAYLTYHEVMTGLYNRNYLNLRLLHGGSEAMGLPVSLVLFDLDGLKQVNDSLGHKAGDDLVIRFASLLRSGLRDNDVALRIGGDEFLLVLPRTDAGGASVILERLRLQCENDRHRPISFSAGIAVKDSRGQNLELLLQEADARMYAQKENRRGEAQAVIHRYIEQTGAEIVGGADSEEE